MFTLVERDIATIVFDFSTLFLIFGIFYYSKVFRKRGLPEDKIFFAILITSVVLTLFETFGSYFDSKPIPGAGFWATVGVTAFYITFDVFFILFMQYAYARRMDNNITLKSWFRPILLPGYLAILIILSTPVTGWFCSYDNMAMFRYGPLFGPVYVIFLIYIVWSFGSISKDLKKKNSRSVVPIWIFLLPFIVGITISIVLPESASFAGICLVMSVAFVHMGCLNEILVSDKSPQ